MNLLKNIEFLNRILWKYNKRYFGVVAISVFVPCVINLVQVVFPREILLSLEKQDFTRTYIIAISMSIIVLLMNIVSLLVEYQKYSYNGEFGITLNKLLAESVSSWSYQKFEDFSFREKYHFASLCVKQGTIENIVGCIASVTGNIISFISLLYVSYVIVWWLWIVIGLSVFINILCEIYRANYDYKSYEKYSTIDMRMLYARDALSWKEFAKESRLFHMYNYVTDTANYYIDLLAKLQQKRAEKTFLAYLLSCIFDFVQRIAIWGYVAYQCYTGNISIADFSMLTLAIIAISALSINIAKNLVRIGEAAKYIGAYADIIRNKELQQDKDTLWGNDDNEFSLVFDNVSFCYPGTDDMALKNVSFTFESNKKYGLVGANGSGKTTFINLLMGMYVPVSGTILYNGKKICDIADESWRTLFSAVLQDFNVYAYSVKENVTMFLDCEKRVRDSLERAGINWMDENNYITSEYEQGKELSGGEAQKLAIARAIYKDAKIFVFDEPTAALSPKNEYELYENIHREMKDKMLFFISHRLASC